MVRRQTAKPTASKWPSGIIAVGIFLAEVVVVRGAASPFRLPKEAVAFSMICLAVGLAVASAARRDSILAPRGRMAAVLFTLPAIQVVSALWSASPIRAIESAFFSLAWVFLILWLATLDSSARRRLAVVAAIGAAASALVMVLQIAGFEVFDFGRAVASTRLRLTGLSGNPADLAMAMVLLLPLLLPAKDELRPIRIHVVLVLVLSLATLLTLTLSGIAALSLIVVIWLYQQRSRKLWLVAAAIGTAFLALGLAAGLGTRLVQGFQQVRAGDWYRLLSARGDGWSAATEMVRERPISGVGAANYDYLFYPSRLDWFSRHGGVGKRGELATHFSWAHNDPLQLAAELGIFGIGWLIALVVTLVHVRRRAGPFLALAAAAYAPFALLHYPSHLAVGLIPIALLLGEIISTTEPMERTLWRHARAPVAIAAIVLAIIGLGWQLRRVAADFWIGNLEMVLAASERVAPEIRVQRAAAVEAAILPRIDRMKRYAPTLWRAVGRARYMRRDFRGSETAFRKAYDGWPHEDADFYLGLALAAQGRRTEGLRHLGRVCRTNPRLIRLIGDKDLRRAVEDMLEAYRRS